MIGHRLPATMDLDAFKEALARMPEDEAWEWVEGRVSISSVGHTCGHNMLVQNISHGIARRMREMGLPHRTFVMTFYLKSVAIGSALLPHVMVRNGRLPPAATSCDDPIAIVEVCEWGETGGREDRWAVCRRLPSLGHYVVVESEVPAIRIYDRAGEAWYEARTLNGLDAVLDLSALGLSIPLAEIYRDVLSA